jgi:TRAP transporter TAXI family solute receptor
MGQITARVRRRWIGLAALVAATLMAAGCTRGPDETALRQEVQGKLDQRFKPGLFAVAGFRRQGSAPLPGSESGAKRLAVYYNTTLKLNQGYDFGDWQGLSPATLAHVLGATEKGIQGLKAGENRPGEVIQVYGSSTYEWSGDRWQGVEVTTAGVARQGEPGNAAPASPSKQLIDRLAAMVDIPPPGIGPQDEAVITEELDRALRAITARRERRKRVYTVASGPEEGEYHPIAEALVAWVAKLDQALKVRNAETAGSVENIRLIAAKQADYALVQSNVAALAAAGEGPFAQGGAVTSLRALGSLFPEPVHIVVSAASAIRTVGDLRGKRVAIGPPDSGTRADAVAVLAAHGLEVKDLAEVRDEGLEDAAARLRAGRIDAFFATVGAPTRELQRLATRHPVRLLSLDVAAIERLVTQNPGLVRLLIPANTYPGQKEDVTTVAATAVLVTHGDVPESEAALALRLVFENPDYLAAGSAQGAKISKRNGLRGITIPMHAAASRYFGVQAPAGPSAPGAPSKGAPTAPPKNPAPPGAQPKGSPPGA